MTAWFAENAGTIIVSLLIAGIVIAVIVSKIRAKKQGKSTCGCGCAGCAMRSACHPAKEKQQ